VTEQKIKVGVLFSQSGPMAVTEEALIRGTLLAIEEINGNGGINGRKIDPIILDPAGDDQRYAQLATELLLKHHVNVIFGCCLSASRKRVLPVVERFNGILFYPSVYEGFEYSPNVIYGGAVPNQLVLPLMQHLYAEEGRKMALIGSDTLYAREINRIVSEFAAESDGQIVSKLYLPFGTNEATIAAKLRETLSKDPNVILSTVVGGDSVTLYTAYARLTDSESRPPIASLTTTESELAKIPAQARAGHFMVAPYFSTTQTDANKQFLESFRKRFGNEISPGVYSAAAYSQVHFFADAARLAGQFDSESLLSALSGAVFKAPGGNLSIDLDTNHFTLRPQVARSNAEGEYDIVWSSPQSIRPDPYLVSYDRNIGELVNT
jgi:branched-chain amino acid transport system substrate-binding protein